MDSAWNKIETFPAALVGGLLLAGLVGIGIINAVYAVIKTFVKLMDFRVVREPSQLLIDYGLLQKLSFRLPIEKVNAVIINQNFIRQLCGLCSVEVTVIGYGDEQKEVALLIPLCKRSEAEDRIAHLPSRISAVTGHGRLPEKSDASYVRVSYMFICGADAVTVVCELGLGGCLFADSPCFRLDLA